MTFCSLWMMYPKQFSIWRTFQFLLVTQEFDHLFWKSLYVSWSYELPEREVCEVSLFCPIILCIRNVQKLLHRLFVSYAHSSGSQSSFPWYYVAPSEYFSSLWNEINQNMLYFVLNTILLAKKQILALEKGFRSSVLKTNSSRNTDFFSICIFLHFM